MKQFSKQIWCDLINTKLNRYQSITKFLLFCVCICCCCYCFNITLFFHFFLFKSKNEKYTNGLRWLWINFSTNNGPKKTVNQWKTKHSMYLLWQTEAKQSEPNLNTSLSHWLCQSILAFIYLCNAEWVDFNINIRKLCVCLFVWIWLNLCDDRFR